MDKTLFGYLLLASFLAIASGLRCWVCENAYGQEDCLRKGYAKRCNWNQDYCHLELRHEGTGRSLPRIRKSCKTLRSCGNNYVQNLRPAWSSMISSDQVQCNEQFPSSVCRCCCSGDLCNKDQASCLKSEIKNSCPAIRTPAHGSMECFDGFKLLSVCRFFCERGYIGSGKMKLRCGFFGEWDGAAPFCKLLQCPRIKAPKYGRVTNCRKGNYLGSRCSFACDEGYVLHGRKTLKCAQQRDTSKPGVWIPRYPICRPLECPSLRPFRNGFVRCTNQNFVGSTCTMDCDKSAGFALNLPLGSAQSLTCDGTQLWNKRKPCCKLPCPPFAPMDFIVVLDSSSSVMAPNWVKTIDFVVQFISEFEIRNDSTHVAAFRYNRAVDKKSQILLNSYPNNRAELLAAIRRIPYDGSGTNTGRAIDHLIRNVLPIGNRRNVRDVVLIITDGISQDRVRLPSRRLRNTGALVYVLPVNPGNGQVDMKQIITIAGGSHFRENVFTDALENGFDALDEDFAARITQLLCRQECDA